MAIGSFMRLVAPWAWLGLARYGIARLTVVVCSAAVAATIFPVIFVTLDFWLIALCLLVLHLFWSASLPLVEAITLGQIGSMRGGYGRVRLWGSVGFIAAVVGSGVLLDSAPITTLLWLTWAFLLLTLWAALRLSENGGRSLLLKSGRSFTWINRRTLSLVAAGFFMTAAHGALYVFYSIYLFENGYEKSLIGLFWMVGVLAEIFVFFIWSRLARVFSLRQLLLISFSLAVMRFYTIGVGVSYFWILLFAQLLHGASFGIHHAATMAALARWLSPQQQSVAQGTYGSLAYGAGGLFGALIAGWLWSSAGALAAFGGSSILALIGLILIWTGIPTENAASAV